MVQSFFFKEYITLNIVYTGRDLFQWSVDNDTTTHMKLQLHKGISVWQVGCMTSRFSALRNSRVNSKWPVQWLRIVL